MPSRSSNAKPSCWSGWIPDGLSGFLPDEPQGRLIIQAQLRRGAKYKVKQSRIVPVGRTMEQLALGVASGLALVVVAGSSRHY